jgi:NAD(P)-dependent dehydrogenase (short-subunit alcohol dehydrogenase family)
MKDLQGRVAVVTGAASGIGKALAEKSVHEGMKVVLADIEEQALEQTAREFSALGGEVLTVRTDVSKAEDVATLADKAFATYGEVHLLFNNAGVGVAEKAIWESSLADWQWVMGVNLWGVIHGIHYFVPHLLKQDTESHIVNTASIAGLISTKSLGIYKVTKHGVVSLSETLALELAGPQAHVKVSVLCPQWVNTQITTAERNRPPELQNAEATAIDPVVAAGFQYVIQTGMPTSEVAEKTFDAIRQEKFYILTHPETKPAIAIRMADILEERAPTDIGGIG